MRRSGPATAAEPQWRSSPEVKGAIISGDVAGEVTRLKQQLAGDIVVFGSNPLVRTLIEHDLVDELRLVVFPVVLGAGERLFGEVSGIKPMRLIDARIIGDSLAFLTYKFARDA